MQTCPQAGTANQPLLGTQDLRRKMSEVGKSKVKITIVSTKDTTRVTDQVPDDDASEASYTQVTFS